MTRIGVVADTHIRRSGKRTLTPVVMRELARADVILHAGDIVVADVLDDLGRLAPVHAVLGNNDEPALAKVLPERLDIQIDGVGIGMVHDAGARAGRERRVRRMFPGASVVVYGHSHVVHNARGVDGQILFNPGSPTDKRREPHFTIGMISIAQGAVVGARHVIVDP